MNPPIPLVMKIVILFDWRMEFFCVSLGPRIFILKSIGGQIILNSHWLLKDEEAIDWREGFRSLKGSRGTSSRKVKEAYQGERSMLGGGKGKEENECVSKRLILMCLEGCCSKKMCARIKHGRISMTKPLEFCFK
jgi:hypothetical protein